MTNLLDNALKFGHSAVIEIDEDERQVAIRIMDNGPGIPEAELGRCYSRSTGLKRRATAKRAAPG